MEAVMNQKEKEDLKRKIDFAEIVSFDMFDTLVFRKCVYPEDIFEEVGFFTGEEGFAEKRKQAQREASKEGMKRKIKPHAGFDEIYQKLETYSVHTEILAQTEIEIEKKELIPNYVMQEIYSYARKRKKKSL